MKKYLKKIIDISSNPEMKILPGQLAFFSVMSIIPILSLIGLLASSFNISMDVIIDFMKKSMPEDVSNTLIPFISGTGMDLQIGFYMIVGFVIASNGPYSLIVTSNQLYEINESTYLKRRIKAFFLTILFVLFSIFIVVALAFGDIVVSFVTNLYLIKSIAHPIQIMYSFLKIPIGFLIILLIIKLIYKLCPDKKIKSKHTTKGALFASVSIILITIIYSFYVSNFAKYNIFYGGLTNIVVMMMWIYFISYIIVIGISINVNSYKEE